MSALRGPRPSSRPLGKRRRGPHPVLVSLAAILAIVFVTYYAFDQGLPFVHRFTLYALVDNSVNVRADSPVRIAGIDVGAVQGVTPDGNLSKIAFTMDASGLPVHKDATIRIRDRLFLEGAYYLELDPGSPSAPALGDGGTIPPAQTSTPVQFYKLLSTFDVASRASLTNLVKTVNTAFSASPGAPLSSSGAAGLKQAIPQLTPVLKDVAWVTRALRGTQAGDVPTLLSSASDVTSTLAGGSAQLADLVTGLNRSTAALASSDGALAQSISGIDRTLQVAPSALGAIDRALPPLAHLATALDPSLQVASPLVDSITAAVGQLAAVVAPMQRARLLSTLRATFTEFPSILRQLAGAFPLTKQVTDCLQSHIVPVFRQQVPDGSLSSGRPVWQDFVHFLPSVAGASGSFDANGPYTRVLAGAGTNSLSGGALGNIPLVGQLVGSAPPGGSSLLGARPAWVGDLTSADFRPDVACSSQPVPSLSAPAAAPDARTRNVAPAGPATLGQARAGLARAGAPGVSGR